MCVCGEGGGLFYDVVLSCLVIKMLERERWWPSFSCAEAVCVLCLFLTVPWVGLQSVIVVFSGHTHLLLYFVRFWS